MSRNFSVLTMVMAGTICAGLVAACSDRFGEYKSRKYTCDEYNVWARKNNQPLHCQPPEPKPQENTPPKPEAETRLSTTTGDGVFGTDGSERDAHNQLLIGRDVISKKEWLDNFSKALKTAKPELKNDILGITIASGKSDAKATMSLSAVVMFDDKPHLLTMNPETTDVTFDKDKVNPLNIELRKARNAQPDARVKDNFRLSASCLSPESATAVCEEFGVLLEIRVLPKSMSGKTLNSAHAVFLVKTGANSTGDVTQTGIYASNLGIDIKPMVEGENQLPSDKPAVTPGAGLSGGAPETPKTTKVDTAPPAEITDDELLSAAKTAFEFVEKKQKKLLDAKDAAEKAQVAKEADKADAEAEAATKSAKAAVEADDQVKALTAQVMPKLKTDEAKTSVTNMIEESKKLKDEALEAARVARNAAAMAHVDSSKPQPPQAGEPQEQPAEPKAASPDQKQPQAQVQPKEESEAARLLRESVERDPSLPPAPF